MGQILCLHDRNTGEHSGYQQSFEDSILHLHHYPLSCLSYWFEGLLLILCFVVSALLRLPNACE